LDQLIKSGKDTLLDLTDEEFDDYFVFNNKMRESLMSIWITFARNFSDKVDETVIHEIRAKEDSKQEQFTLFLLKLRNSTKEIQIVQFLKAFKKTVNM
jgi:hypothetical protein